MGCTDASIGSSDIIRLHCKIYDPDPYMALMLVLQIVQSTFAGCNPGLVHEKIVFCVI